MYDKNNIPYTLCFPTKESINIYKERYIKRGNNENYINEVVNTYERVYDEFKERNKPEIILDGNETLEDWLIKNNYPLIK